jgi:RNA polymerase primary sigma factor
MAGETRLRSKRSIFVGCKNRVDVSKVETFIVVCLVTGVYREGGIPMVATKESGETRMEYTVSKDLRSSRDPSVQHYLKELRKYPPMTREEEEATLQKARAGNQEAIDRIITSNLRFVVSVALEYQGRGVPLADLIAEGNVGLLEALKRFDENRGFKFISYAVWWIRQGILNALKRTSTVIMPANRQEDMDRMARRWGQMTQELGRVPTLDEVATDMKISRKRAERALRCVRPDLSLETPLDSTGEQTLIHRLESDETNPEEWAEIRDQADLVTQSLGASLDDREAKVIRSYFGLDGQDRSTLGEIGNTLGVTRERVRQIRNRALYKLRRYLRHRVPGGKIEDLV